jgi:hypothetical protein
MYQTFHILFYTSGYPLVLYISSQIPPLTSVVYVTVCFFAFIFHYLKNNFNASLHAFLRLHFSGESHTEWSVLTQVMDSFKSTF